eukprot:TRINITY_DN4050_c0_g2_i2.p1 TRINITY_DN4050_c0_g2~~TRINITY_DN4050_c0_g2_i2.p1  ORF type:complete len:760 (-),score=226.79 TRINITY_DN4050_c0_g2_i2:230-2485(-)
MSQVKETRKKKRTAATQQEGRFKDNAFVSVAIDRIAGFCDLESILQMGLVCSSWRTQINSGFIWTPTFTQKFKESHSDIKDLKLLRVYRYIRMNEDMSKTILAVLESQTLLREMAQYKVKNPTTNLGYLPEIRSLMDNTFDGADYEKEKELQERIAALRDRLLKKHRKNATIQKSLLSLENKISLLISHQSSIYELERNKKKSKKDKKVEDEEIGDDFTRNQKLMDSYSNFLYMLRSEVGYLASISDYVSSSEMKTFTETVILTLYGNAFSPLEEYLMMELFSLAIKQEFQTLTEGPLEFTEIDSVVPQMIISYTKRKLGKKYIKQVFGAALEDLFEEMEDLGFSPLANTPVQQKRMEEIVDSFFKLIIKTISKLPYGIRYICKKIYDYAHEMFPNATELEVLQTVSYYVIYKFIGAALAAPDNYDICEPADIPGIVSATLAYLSKSLQLIFRFTEADDMKIVGMNGFFRKKHDRARKYLEAVIDVEEADVALKVNRYAKMTASSRPNIIISQREIISLHELFAENAKDLFPEDDPMLEILEELGEVPEPIRPNENIRMELVNRLEVDIKEEQKHDDIRRDTLKNSILLLQKAGGIPSGKTFLDILIKLRIAFDKEGRPDMVEEINDLIANLQELESSGADLGEGFSVFLEDIFLEIEDIALRIEELEKEVTRLETALEEIAELKTVMENKINAFDLYLDTLRRDAADRFKKKSKKFSYKDLVKKGVIAEIGVDESMLKKINFVISQTSFI